MGQIIQDIKSVIIDRQGNYRKRIIMSVIISLLGLLTAIWFISRIYFYDGNCNWSHNLDFPSVGQFGDFFGGFIGTLFSIVGIILLYETLALQRYESEETRKVLTQQQFENTYFSLIKIYNESVEKIYLKIIYEDATEEKLTGLEYFAFKRQQLYDDFTATNSILKSSKTIKNSYTLFYIENKTQLSIYFRTLYRLFRFIESSNLTERKKMEYSKIIRAQLNEDELFFIYYNAFSNFGEKFQVLINKYNITKHLPLLSKIEYKEYSLKLNDFERSGVEYVLEELKKDIQKMLVDNNKIYYHKEYLEQKYKLSAYHKNNEIKVELIVDNLKVTKPEPQQGYGMQILSNDDLEKMFLIFLKDTFNYSNFNKVNLGIKITTAIEDIQNTTSSKITATTIMSNGARLQTI